MKKKPYKLQSRPIARDVQNYGPISTEKIQELYESVAHLFSNEQREYLENMMNGEAEMDPLLDLEMFFRVVNIYAIQAVTWSLEERKVSKDIASILGEVRQGATAIENMRVKRSEVKEEVDNETGMVDPTRKSKLSFLESLDQEFNG